MTLSASKSPSVPFKSSLQLWSERLLALIALANFGWFAFDATYIRGRDWYFKLAPAQTTWYGETFKGMEPERSTVAYLQAVTTLEAQIAQQGLSSPQVQATFADLQNRSIDLINENPFQVANKSGTLERIKNRMRDRIGLTSAKDSFQRFWSVAYFTQVGTEDALQYFNRQIKPLMELNYFRHIGEDGEPIDRFWRVDLAFISIFGLIILGRASYLHWIRHYRWSNALFWRWSDWLLVVPFANLPIGYNFWVLRIFPIAAWLQEARLANFRPLRHRFNQRVAKFFAAELTDAVVLRVVDQIQDWIQSGAIVETLARSQQAQRVDLNGVDELALISEKVTAAFVDQVLPEVKPELDALLRHSLFGGLDQAPLYRNIHWLPGVSQTSNLISQQITARISQTLYSAIQAIVHDPIGQTLTRELIQKIVQEIQAEIIQGQTMDDLPDLIVALLEEFKLSYRIQDPN